MHGTYRAVETSRPPKKLKALHPNQGIQATYRKRLEKLIRDMHRSVLYWIRAQYRATPPKMAMDEPIPANALARAIKALAARWLKKFDDGAWALADYFTGAVGKRTDAALGKILREAGFSVKFQITPAVRDILQATVQQNVSLIKSIPEQYLKNVEGAVMRSVQKGRDLGGLAKELQKNYGVTKRRAAFIARSQNNMATGAINAARQVELGLQATWRHSGAGKHPRPTHLRNNGKLYDPKKGWFDPDPKVKAWIFPGQLPECRCVSITVVPGFDTEVSPETERNIRKHYGHLL